MLIFVLADRLHGNMRMYWEWQLLHTVNNIVDGNKNSRHIFNS